MTYKNKYLIYWKYSGRHALINCRPCTYKTDLFAPESAPGNIKYNTIIQYKFFIGMKHITMRFAKYIHFKRVGTYFNIYMIVIKKQQYDAQCMKRPPMQFTDTPAQISLRSRAGRTNFMILEYGSFI